MYVSCSLEIVKTFFVHCEFEEASLMQKEQKSDKMAVVGKKRLETTDDDSTIDDDEEERSLSGYFFHWH